ncbi:MAG: hypothetical protein NZ954_08205 [Thermofilaceae archaeon]|nr:hypothetical protein [Thermofilaceae archaeon]MCX8181397.1 hypothetical protein [Thermofilaceae archaeon]MDW8004686.1 hypothetical protein [Thermofilaceae archaeon]
MSQKVNVLDKLLNVEEYRRAKEFLVRYLAAYKVVEQNLSLFDKMARCRDVNDFVSAVYEGVRVKDRVLDKLVEGVEKNELRVVFEYKNVSDLRNIFNVGQEHIELIIGLAREDPKLVGSYISALALAYGGISERR